MHRQDIHFKIILLFLYYSRLSQWPRCYLWHKKIRKRLSLKIGGEMFPLIYRDRMQSFIDTLSEVVHTRKVLVYKFIVQSVLHSKNYWLTIINYYTSHIVTDEGKVGDYYWSKVRQTNSYQLKAKVRLEVLHPKLQLVN